MFTKFTVIIISFKSNHYAVHIRLIQSCMSIKSQQNWREKNECMGRWDLMKLRGVPLLQVKVPPQHMELTPATKGRRKGAFVGAFSSF